ncbi:hypothetical protein [Geomonas propionica]|uniref:Uncharacterized protein n=1 Tax=Geomonas propionica TaxID=2798582 RepID=A0ABS0YV31_9BACT|nr:hypothetical protein [Geomonas propionica]MBJ6801826.1 hypothetical protein [Geomonas propionica]
MKYLKEGLIKECIALSPLLCGALALILSITLDHVLPKRTVTYDEIVPQYAWKEVELPENHLATDPPSKLRRQNLKMAVMDGSGRPILIHKKITKKVPYSYDIVLSDWKEVTSEKLGVPNYSQKIIYPPRSSPTQSIMPQDVLGVMQYELNIIEEGTGVFYPVRELKKIRLTYEFSTGVGSILGVMMSTWLLLRQLKKQSTTMG